MSSSHSTPSKSSKTATSKAGSKSKASSSRSSRSSPCMFTPQMQDRQARNKDPYSSSDDSSDSAWEGQNRKFDAYGNEPYETVQKRREAAVVLDNPELLMMHAQARFDSIPGTRHYFTKLLCGYQDEKDPYLARPRDDSAEKNKFRANREAQGSKRSL